MAEEHSDNQMIQRALAGKVKEDEDRALMKISRKKHHKSSHLLIQLPKLNTALVEAFEDLNHTTRKAKQMAR